MVEAEGAMLVLLDGPLRRAQLTRHELEQRRLAAAVAAHERVRAAALQGVRGLLEQVRPTARVRHRKLARLELAEEGALGVANAYGADACRLELLVQQGLLALHLVGERLGRPFARPGGGGHRLCTRLCVAAAGLAGRGGLPCLALRLLLCRQLLLLLLAQLLLEELRGAIVDDRLRRKLGRRACRRVVACFGVQLFKHRDLLRLGLAGASLASFLAHAAMCSAQLV
mmetsp:Transcript_45983/g.148117  ORF Transcript_45983/g.148117 Transcript_45983/m.148117 type:complete len:227 (-) Transcript_45983:110-790(-)